MNNAIRIKTGDTFSAHATYTPENQDDPTSLQDYTLKSQIRSPSGDIVFEVTCLMDPDFLGFTLSLTDAQTAQIPPGQYQIDVLFTYGGTKKHSETFLFIVERGITQ